MAELFGVQVPAINKHLANIFASGELQEEAVVSILEITATDGKILKNDIAIAKNYLSEQHIKELNFDKQIQRLVSGEGEDNRDQ